MSKNIIDLIRKGKDLDKDKEKPPRAALLIVYTADGGIQMEGPLADKMTCFGMLGMAVATLNHTLTVQELIKAGHIVTQKTEGQPGNA